MIAPRMLLPREGGNQRCARAQALLRLVWSWAMETIDQGKFTCQSCGKSYRWKPEFAGKKVKCKCGTVMTAPKSPPRAAPPPPPAADGPDLDALYALAD